MTGSVEAARSFSIKRSSPVSVRVEGIDRLATIDFRIDQEKILDRKLSVAIEVPTHEELGTRFPMSTAGNPTINARLLLEDE